MNKRKGYVKQAVRNSMRKRDLLEIERRLDDVSVSNVSSIVDRVMTERSARAEKWRKSWIKRQKKGRCVGVTDAGKQCRSASLGWRAASDAESCYCYQHYWQADACIVYDHELTDAEVSEHTEKRLLYKKQRLSGDT